MRYSLTLKNIEPSPTIDHFVEKEAAKIKKKVSNFASDLPILSILVKKEALEFTGIIWLYLPKKPLVAHFKSITLPSGVIQGFARIEREIDTYKGQHFAGSSKYSDRTTIRKHM